MTELCKQPGLPYQPYHLQAGLPRRHQRLQCAAGRLGRSISFPRRAGQNHVFDRYLLCSSAVPTVGVLYFRDPSLPQEQAEAYLPCAKLNQQRRLLLSHSMVALNSLVIKLR